MEARGEEQRPGQVSPHIRSHGAVAHTLDQAMAKYYVGGRLIFPPQFFQIERGWRRVVRVG